MHRPDTKNSTTVRSSQRPMHASQRALRLAVAGLARVAPPLAESLVATLFGVPLIGRRTPPTVPGWKARTLALRGPRHGLRVHTFGDGAYTVLLVHGWNGHSGQLTRFVRPLVANGFRAALLDLPAHGASSGRTATLVDFADAIAVT